MVDHERLVTGMTLLACLIAVGSVWAMVNQHDVDGTVLLLSWALLMLAGGFVVVRVIKSMIRQYRKFLVLRSP